MLESILVAVFTSATATGIFVLFVNTYLKNLIKYEFRKREKRLDALIESSRIFSNAVAKEQVGLYPELAELMYRISVIMRKGIKKKNAIEWDITLRELSSQLTELLFKYRFYFSTELFEALHEFKHATQDTTMILDYLSRQDHIDDTVDYIRMLPELIANSEKIEKLEKKIVMMIKAPTTMGSRTSEKSNYSS